MLEATMQFSKMRSTAARHPIPAMLYQRGTGSVHGDLAKGNRLRGLSHPHRPFRYEETWTAEAGAIVGGVWTNEPVYILVTFTIASNGRSFLRETLHSGQLSRLFSLFSTTPAPSPPLSYNQAYLGVAQPPPTPPVLWKRIHLRARRVTLAESFDNF